LVVSGASFEGLRGQAGALVDHLRDRGDLSLVDLGWSLLETRAALEYRGVVLAADLESALAGLSALAGGDSAGAVFVGRAVDEHLAGSDGSGEGADGVGDHDVDGSLVALAERWVRGGDVDWGAVFDGMGARVVELPTYAFQRERYWADLDPAVAGGEEADDSIDELIESADDDQLLAIIDRELGDPGS
jgi:acyl transferase domain-containing protein